MNNFMKMITVPNCSSVASSIVIFFGKLSGFHKLSLHGILQKFPQFSECVPGALAPEKNAAFASASTIPTQSIKYECSAGYSFERPEADARNQQDVKCLYSSGSGAFLEDEASLPSCIGF